MATTAAPSLCVATTRPCISSSAEMFKPSRKADEHRNKLRGSCHVVSRQGVSQRFVSQPRNFVTRATMHKPNETKPMSGLAIDLRGKRAFIAGVGDDSGYGWAIAKSLAAAGAEILVGTWVPIANIFQQNLSRGKLDESRILPDCSLMDIAKVYPLDASYDNPEDVPEDIKTNRRYAGFSNWTIREVAECVKRDFGNIDIVVHSIANGMEVTKPLMQTSRKGYLGAISVSTYSYLSLMQHFVPIMNQGGASLSLSAHASRQVIPSYGGGMSSAKAALESDTRVLAFELGREKNIRVNAISAGLLDSRAAKAIGNVRNGLDYSVANAPLQKQLSAGEVGDVAAFLLSPLASAVTGTVVSVDNGLSQMAVALDSHSLQTTMDS